MPDFIDLTPSDNAYTPSMAKLKTVMERLLSKANDESISPELFKNYVNEHLLEITGLMSTVLSQDILYKAGVRYKPEDFR